MCILPKAEPQRNGLGPATRLYSALSPVWTGNFPSDSGQQTNGQAVAKIAGWLRLFVEDGAAVELRALKVDGMRTVCGFFDAQHLEEMAEVALGLTGHGEGVYFTLNPLTPDLLARYNNRTSVAGSGDSATDKDVLRRRWLLIDADPVRIAGISSTDEEKAEAWAIVEAVRGHLREQGWPDPVLADSGNGYHLLYRIDLPRDDGDLVKRVLAALAGRFDTADAKVDQKVFNPARIVKLYGTKARKGDGTPQRPHRWAGVLDIPEDVAAVPVASLEAVAAPVPEAATAVRPVPTRTPSRPYRFGPEQVKERARAYLAKLPPAVSGESGHNRTFQAACILVKGFGLSVEEALPILEGWNETCQPPWSEKELRHKLEDAAEQPGPGGYLLDGRDPGAGSLPRANGATRPDAADPEDVLRRQDDDPDRLARLFLTRQHANPGGTTLRFWRGDWYAWDKACYRKLDGDELRGQLWRSVQDEFDRLTRDELHRRAALASAGKAPRGPDPAVPKVTNDLVNNVRGALMSLAVVPAAVEQPAWLEPGARPPAGEMLAARNGLVHLPGLLAGRPAVSAVTPAYFSTTALGYDLDLDAPTPANWLDFLGQLWPDDPESIDTLQEWFGYCLLPDTSLQKLLFLLGPTRSGKGTIARVLRALIGEDNVAGPTLSSLATNFGLWPLLGRPLAVVSDARLSGRADQAAIVERLLAVTGEDALTVDRKNREPVTARLPTRLMLISNELPRLTDASGALVARMVVLKLRRSWLGSEDTGLLNRLLPERPGILRWAIEGLKRLRQRGRFVQPVSGQDELDQMNELSSPIKAFVNETCNLDQSLRVAKHVIFQAWKTWSEYRGYRTGNQATFGRNLHAAFPEIQTSRSNQGARLWSYQGIEVRPDALLEVKP